jgi:hypothetical protein
MQQMTETLKAAIRAEYQVPLAKIEIYNADGSLAGELDDVSSCSINVAGSRKVMRTFEATMENNEGIYSPDPFLYADNLLWYNKTVKIFYGYQTEAGEEWLPQGEYTLDSIKPEITPDGDVLEISGQDLISKMIEDKFDDVYTIKDDLASESGNYALSSLGASASATSWMSRTDPSNVILEYKPINAIDSDVYTTFWMPSSFDDAPVFTVDFGSTKTINCFYTYWGEHSFDYEKRVHYHLERSSDGSSWTRIIDLNGITGSSSLFGDVEHVFDPVSCRYVRIRILSWTGEVMLRHIKAQNITPVESVDKVIRDLATSAGLTKVRLPKTRRWIKQKQSEIGEEKYTLAQDVATAIGWIAPYMDEDGFLTSHPVNIDPVNAAWIFDVETDNIFSFSPRFTNDIYNVILAIYKSSSEKAIVGKAIDNDPESPTSVQQLGRRVMKYENDLIDSQDKADQFAAQKLFERTRFKHQTSLPVTGHPGIQVDDVVQVNVPEAKIKDLKYLITGYETSFDADGAQFDTRINISEL